MFRFHSPHPLVALAISALIAPAAVAGEDWQSMQQQAEQQFSQGRLGECATSYVNALKGAQQARISQADPTMRKLLYDDIPGAIIECVSKRQVPVAKNLAEWKLYAAKQMYGTASVPYIDAEMDMCFVCGATHEQAQGDSYKTEMKTNLQTLTHSDPKSGLESIRLLLRKQQLMTAKLQQKIWEAETMVPAATR